MSASEAEVYRLVAVLHPHASTGLDWSDDGARWWVVSDYPEPYSDDMGGQAYPEAPAKAGAWEAAAKVLRAEAQARVAELAAALASE